MEVEITYFICFLEMIQTFKYALYNQWRVKYKTFHFELKVKINNKIYIFSKLVLWFAFFPACETQENYVPKELRIVQKPQDIEVMKVRNKTAY